VNPSLSNFAPIEIVWTTINFVTLAVTWQLYREAKLDERAVIASGTNGVYRLTVRGDRVRMMLKLIMAGAFMASGIYAGLFVPRNIATANSGLGGFVTVALLIIADLALLALALYSARHRAEIMEALDNEYAGSANQTEDKMFGDQRRELEMKHNEERNDAGAS
jgi:hypothetical protein